MSAMGRKDLSIEAWGPAKFRSAGLQARESAEGASRKHRVIANVRFRWKADTNTAVSSLLRSLIRDVRGGPNYCVELF